MALDFSKTGRGAFQIHVADDNTVTVFTGGHSFTFKTALEAYGAFRDEADAGDHAAWNVCYFLEDVIDDNFPEPALDIEGAQR